jgi:hypothetical protein
MRETEQEPGEALLEGPTSRVADNKRRDRDVNGHQDGESFATLAVRTGDEVAGDAVGRAAGRARGERRRPGPHVDAIGVERVAAAERPGRGGGAEADGAIARTHGEPEQGVAK